MFKMEFPKIRYTLKKKQTGIYFLILLLIYSLIFFLGYPFEERFYPWSINPKWILCTEKGRGVFPYICIPSGFER